MRHHRPAAPSTSDHVLTSFDQPTLAARWSKVAIILALFVALGATQTLPLAASADPARPEKPAPLDCTGPEGVSATEVRKAQAAWAKYLKRDVEETVEIGNGVKMTFVLVPPGKFRMGSPKDEANRSDEETLHEVTLTEPFYLGKYPVTQEQYEALIGKNPSEFKGATFPVEKVSWEEARDYADKLTKKRADRHLYRLPTEAEWEYSCRGGRPSSKPFGIGDGRTLSSHEANFNGNYPYGGAEKGPYLQSTCRVGSYPANALGLFDMQGNVCQWCADWHGLYPAQEVTNPSGPPEGSDRVIRGGGWCHFARGARAADRGRSTPSNRGNPLGFRLARSIPSDSK
jgi:formylglycine-generating enzyme required for sulfatase activity